MTPEHNVDTCQHPDCVTYQEVSIEYCMALMDYLLSAEAVTAHMTQTME